jgi:hypothetical protein
VFLNCKFWNFPVRTLHCDCRWYHCIIFYGHTTVLLQCVFAMVLWRWTTNLWTRNQHHAFSKKWIKVHGISDKLKQV